MSEGLHELSSYDMPLRGILKVSLEIRKELQYVIFDCSLANIGTDDIELGNTYLFIDTGIYDVGMCSYTFPFIQRKFLNIKGVANEDCIMCHYCRLGQQEYPSNTEHINDFYNNTKFDGWTNKCISLYHLSSKSVLHMSPKETMNEELVMKLDSGVYRAILVSVPNSHNCDCMCCNRCFVI